MFATYRCRPLALIVLSITLAGCSKTPGSPVGGSTTGTADQVLVATTLIATPAFTSDSLMDVGTAPAMLASAPTLRGGALNAVSPRYWWRTISSSDHTFTYAFSDSDSTGRPRQADVTVTRHLTGQLNFFTALVADSMRLDSANVVHKPIDDTWVRHLRLRRVRLPQDSTKTAWFVTGASAAAVASNPTTESVVSLRLQATGLDTTLTDPAALWTVTKLFHVVPGDSLTLTATTTHTDDIVLCYWHDRRERFHSNGDGTYSFKLRLAGGEMHRPRFVGVNALSHGTLYDDTLPYDSAAWIFYCMVGGPPSGSHF